MTDESPWTMIFLALVALFSVVVIQWLPNPPNPAWIVAAAGLASMVILFFIALFLCEIVQQLKWLNRLLSGNGVRPELAGTIQRITQILRDE